MADDHIARAGIVAALRSSHMECVADCTADEFAEVMTRNPASCVVAVAESPGRLDRYAALSAITTVLAGHPHCVTTVVARPHDLLIRLRIAESGARLLVDYDAVANEPQLLRRVLVDPGSACHVPTRWELREAAGLAWDGELEPFLVEVRSCPSEVWTSSMKQARLPISRRTVARLRRLAKEQAGLPSPDFRRFATTLRAAPEYPEWATVRLFVQRLLGLAVSRDASGRATDAAAARGVHSLEFQPGRDGGVAR